MPQFAPISSKTTPFWGHRSLTICQKAASYLLEPTINRLLCNEAVHVCKYVSFVEKKSEVPPLSQNNKHKLVSHIAISVIKTILIFWTRRFEDVFY